MLPTNTTNITGFRNCTRGCSFANDARIAAETMGLPIADVTFQLGDSALPKAPVEGGSFTAATVGSAVKEVCEQLRKKVFNLARKMKDSPLADVH